MNIFLWHLNLTRKLFKQNNSNQNKRLKSNRKIVYYSRNLSNNQRKKKSLFNSNCLAIIAIMNGYHCDEIGFKTDLRTITAHCGHHTFIPILLASGSIVAFEKGPKTVNWKKKKNFTILWIKNYYESTFLLKDGLLEPWDVITGMGILLLSVLWGLDEADVSIDINGRGISGETGTIPITIILQSSNRRKQAASSILCS